jgi:hypothetical protein
MNTAPFLCTSRSALALLLALLTRAAGAAGTVEVLHSFGEGDGEYPASEIVIDAAGSL